MRTLTFPVAFLFGVAAMTSPAEAKRVIKEVRLEEGKTPDNTIPEPVLDGSRIKPLTFLPFRQAFPAERGWDRGQPRAVGGTSRSFLESSAQFAPTVDLGALFSQALGQQAKALGLKLGEGGWTIGGTLQDLWIDPWSNGWSTVYYTGLVVNLEITSPDGARTAQTLRLFGVQMHFFESQKATVARLLLEGSQETVARLNATLLKAPSLPAVGKLLAAIDAKGMTDRESMVNAAGLSGDPAGVQVFLNAIARSESEDERGLAIEALGRIGDPAVIAPLQLRFQTENKDARWFILKAMGYIGTPEALAFIKKAALLDENDRCRALAQDLLGAPAAP